MKFLKIFCFLIVFACVCTGISGCALFERDYPVEVGGVEIKVLPERVATLSEAAASSIWALGYKSYLIGAPTTFITDDMVGVTDLGTPIMPNEKALLELAPDVLITATKLSESLTEQLRLRDVKVLTLPTPETYSEVEPYYTELAKLFLGKKKYEEAVSVFWGETERVLSELKTANASLQKKAVVLLEAGYVVTGDTLAGEALEKVGIKNIAVDAKNYQMKKSEVVEANPDVIFCMPGMSDAIFADKDYKKTTAVTEAAVYEIDWIALCYAGEGFAGTLQDMSTYMKQ